MNDNPFSSFLKVIQEEGNSDPSSFCLGTVQGKIVKTSGIMLYEDDLLINKDININDGDIVLLLRIDERFIIICKVVEL